MTNTDESLRKSNCDLIRSFISMINKWDFDSMRQICAPDMIFEIPFTPPGMPNRLEGREELFAYQKKVSKTILCENLHDIWLDTMHSDPAEVIATFRSDMSLADPELSYRNMYVCRFRVEEGLIRMFQECFDSVAAVAGFGGKVIPPGEV